MTEQEFRDRLRELGADIQRHADDEDRDVETAIAQAHQCAGLMLAEWRHIHRHQTEECQTAP